MVKKIQRNIILIIGIIITLAVCSYGIWKNIIDLSLFLVDDKSVHFNILTVNSIIAGFMFSGLSLMVGISGIKTVRELERSKHMDRIYNNVMVGILFNILSIIISLMILFGVELNVEKILVGGEVTFLTVGVVCFAISVIDLKFLITVMRNESKTLDDIQLNEINNLIKEKRESK